MWYILHHRVIVFYRDCRGTEFLEDSLSQEISDDKQLKDI